MAKGRLSLFLSMSISVFLISGCSRQTFSYNIGKKTKDVQPFSPKIETNSSDRNDFGPNITEVNYEIVKESEKNSINDKPSYNPGPEPIEKSPKIDKPLETGKGSKMVFITIDDGPSELTPKFIDVLNENGVQATFFVVGFKAANHPEIIKKAYESGHAVANHSYNHNYKDIYKSSQALLDSVEKCNQTLESIIQRTEMEKNFLRFPGGTSSSQLVKGDRKGTIELLKSKGYNTLEWNKSTADSSPYKAPVEVYVNNATNTGTMDTVVVLMHDTGDKHSTLAALPLIIKYYKDNGYVFKTVRDMTPGDLDRLKNAKIANRAF